jgi:hypothetical protein
MTNETKYVLFVGGIPAAAVLTLATIVEPLFLFCFGIAGLIMAGGYGWGKLGEKLFPLGQEKKQLYSADDMADVDRYMEDIV